MNGAEQTDRQTDRQTEHESCRRLTVGSLFAGIGGFDLGFERAGFETKWQIEIDPWRREHLRQRFPSARQYGDIRAVDWNEVERVDVLVGGFPCQDISNAGPRVGIRGERSGLWSAMRDAIRALRPDYVVVENSTGILTRGLDIVLGDLAESGYDAEWQCVSASDVGAPHERDRFFAVAYPNEINGKAGLGSWPAQRWPVFADRDPERADFWLASTCKAVGVDDGLSRQFYRQRVEAIGDSVSPIVTELIARRIKDAVTDNRHREGRDRADGRQ